MAKITVNGLNERINSLHEDIAEIKESQKEIISGQNEIKEMMLHPENGFYRRLFDLTESINRLQTQHDDLNASYQSMKKWLWRVLWFVIGVLLTGGSILGYSISLTPK